MGAFAIYITRHLEVFDRLRSMSLEDIAVDVAELEERVEVLEGENADLEAALAEQEQA